MKDQKIEQSMLKSGKDERRLKRLEKKKEEKKDLKGKFKKGKFGKY